MSKRTREIRDLIKALPEPKEITKVMKDLRNQPDRIAAIMAGAMVEAVLERLLIASFTHKTKATQNALFGQSGPLSTFAAKIQIAHAFGILSDFMAAELMRLKNIRNVFAHAATNVTFETPEIAKETEAFALLDAVQGVNSLAKHFVVNLSGRKGYVFVATVLSQLLDADIVQRGGTPVYELAGQGAD